MCEISKRHKRFVAGVIYLFLGVIVLGFAQNLFSLPLLSSLINKLLHPAILWCIGWAALGVGAGVINTRNHDYTSSWVMQHICYCGFVLLSISILSFVVALNLVGPHFNADKPGIKFLSISAAVGLIGGFLVDIFHSLAEKLIPIKK